MTAHERIALAEFLARLDDASAAEARAAASRIDELARAGKVVEGVERRFLPFAVVAALMFVAGLWFFLVPGTASPAVRVACLGALPAVAVIYGLRVMGRTRADKTAEDLNRLYFLPHGGIYFAADKTPACVVLVPAQSVSPARQDGKITRKDIWW